MVKQHLTDEGPKRCTARSAESCPAKFNGEKAEHFNNNKVAWAAFTEVMDGRERVKSIEEEKKRKNTQPQVFAGLHDASTTIAAQNSLKSMAEVVKRSPEIIDSVEMTPTLVKHYGSEKAAREALRKEIGLEQTVSDEPTRPKLTKFQQNSLDRLDEIVRSYDKTVDRQAAKELAGRIAKASTSHDFKYVEEDLATLEGDAEQREDEYEYDDYDELDDRLTRMEEAEATDMRSEGDPYNDYQRMEFNDFKKDQARHNTKEPHEYPKDSPEFKRGYDDFLEEMPTEGSFIPGVGGVHPADILHRANPLGYARGLEDHARDMGTRLNKSNRADIEKNYRETLADNTTDLHTIGGVKLSGAEIVKAADPSGKLYEALKEEYIEAFA